MSKNRILILIALFVINFSFTSWAQSDAYLVAEANDYFREGRYWDAFFMYRTAAKSPEHIGNPLVEQQIKNSSRAMYLKKKYSDYRALKNYELAKQNLIQLVEINPEDPTRGEIPKISLEQGEILHRVAWRQRTPEGTAAMLQRAIGHYHQAIKEGLSYESIGTLIRMAEKSLSDTGVKDAPNNPVISTKFDPRGNQPTQTTRAVEILPSKENNNKENQPQ